MNAEEFKRKFLPLHPKLYRVALAFTGNRDDAEDILQETYGKLWAKRNELGKLDNPETWCVKIVKNLCLDFMRSPQTSKMTDEDAGKQLECETSGSDPGQEMEEKEKLIAVKNIIDTLPYNQKQVIRLYGMAGCSLEEIEKLTGLGNGNIRVLLSRARKQIRERLINIYGL